MALDLKSSVWQLKKEIKVKMRNSHIKCNTFEYLIKAHNKDNCRKELTIITTVTNFFIILIQVLPNQRDLHVKKKNLGFIFSFLLQTKRMLFYSTNSSFWQRLQNTDFCIVLWWHSLVADFWALLVAMALFCHLKLHLQVDIPGFFLSIESTPGSVLLCLPISPAWTKPLTEVLLPLSFVCLSYFFLIESKPSSTCVYLCLFIG